MSKIFLKLSFTAAVLFSTSIASNAQASTSDKKIGVLFGSYGDVDELSEVRELVLNTTQDPDVVPLPLILRHIFSKIGWLQDKAGILEEYEAIGGGTGMRANSKAQAELTAEALIRMGYDAKGYVGFTMTFPYIEDTMDKIRADGIDELIVLYQGAQYSQVTGYIVFREVEAYLDDNPGWDVNVQAVKSFSDDPRFSNLIIDRIRNRMVSDFPEADPSEICVFMPAHGNLYKWIDLGDPSYDQMLQVFDTVTKAFPESYVSYGFQNHDEMPFFDWTAPDTDTALDEIAAQDCPYIIINGMVSFTVGSLETIFDHGITQVEYLQEQAAALGTEKEIVVEGVFDDDPLFADFIAEVVDEALHGFGDITPVGNGAIKSISINK